MKTRPDVTAERIGYSIISFDPCSRRARAWVKKHVNDAPTGSFLCDFRYALDIAEGMRAAGLRVV